MRDGDEPGDVSGLGDAQTDSDDDDDVSSIAHCDAQRDSDDDDEWRDNDVSGDDEPADFIDEKGDVDHESESMRIGRVLRGEVFLFREFIRSSDQGGSSREGWDDAYDESESESEGSAHFPFFLSGEEGRSDAGGIPSEPCDGSSGTVDPLFLSCNVANEGR